MREPDDADIVRAVIRGQLPLSMLAEAGVTVTFRAADPEGKSKQIVVVQERPFELKLRVSDIAAGLLRHLQEHDDRNAWASFLLAADWIDFEPLESHPDGDSLLGGLWDASFGGEISGTAIEAANRVGAE